MRASSLVPVGVTVDGPLTAALVSFVGGKLQSPAIMKLLATAKRGRCQNFRLTVEHGVVIEFPAQTGATMTILCHYSPWWPKTERKNGAAKSLVGGSHARRGKLRPLHH